MFTKHNFKSVIILCVAMAIVAVASYFVVEAGQERQARSDLPCPAAPDEYRSLYHQLDEQMGEVENQIARWGKSPGNQAVGFSAELLAANGNLGEHLLTPQALMASRMLLDRLREMGFRSVNIEIKYPMLLPAFPRSAEYLYFYKQIVAGARKRGLMVTIECGTTFSEDAFSVTQVDYSPLTLAQFQRDIHQMAQLIIDELQPAYLSVLDEPDTQSKNTGLDLTVENYRELLQGALQGVKPRSTRIGAGAGTWSDLRYFEMLALQPDLDFIDLHVYPIGGGLMTHKIEAIARLAAQNKKRLAVGEAWLYKAAAQEMGHDMAAAARIFQRDVYSFWQPLDIRFIEALARVAEHYHFEFCNYFWTRNFFGEIEYNQPTKDLTPKQAFDLIRQTAGPNVAAGKLTATGEAMKELLRRH